MIFDFVKGINDKQHYLARSSVQYSNYISSLNKILCALKNRISDNKLKLLVKKKLQLGGDKDFNEIQYIQTACELTVMGDFIDYPKAQFVYEDQVTHPKDVDFSMIIGNYKYNVEVKCASYVKENKNADEVALIFTSRAPTSEMREKLVADIRYKLLPAGRSVKEGKNLDNVMKDFLTSAQEKMKNSDSNDINILVVCCNDEIDMQIWRGYLFGVRGYFTDSSQIPHELFDHVNFVLFTNIYNRHFQYFHDFRLSNHWSLSSSFNLLYPNKYSKLSDSLTLEQGKAMLNEVSEIFPNHSINFEKYLLDKNDIPVGESIAMKDILGIAWYADKFKASGRFYFRNPDSL